MARPKKDEPSRHRTRAEAFSGGPIAAPWDADREHRSKILTERRARLERLDRELGWRGVDACAIQDRLLAAMHGDKGSVTLRVRWKHLRGSAAAWAESVRLEQAIVARLDAGDNASQAMLYVAKAEGIGQKRDGTTADKVLGERLRRLRKRAFPAK